MRLEQGGLAGADALRGHVGTGTGVVRRDDRHVGVGVVDLVQLDVGDVRDQLHRRDADELAADGIEAETDESPGAAAGELAGHLLDQGPRGRLGADQHLPAGLRLDAVDQYARVRLDPRVHARDPSRVWRASSRAPNGVRSTCARRMAGTREERVAPERLQPGVGLGLDRRRPRNVPEQGDLAERVAGPELTARRAVHGHLRRPDSTT